MSLLRQPCPNCGRNLELPAEAVGKTARCPACEATFPVQSDQNAEAPLEVPAASEPPPSSPPPPPPSTAANPYAEPPSSGSYGAGTATAAANPYQASSSGGTATRIGPFDVTDRSIESIVSTTLSVFGRGWAPVILSGLIAAVATVVAFVVPFAIFVPLVVLGANGGGPAPFVAFGAMFLLLPLLAILSAYLMVGMSRVMLAVARDEPSPLAEMMPPMILVGRCLLGGIVLFVIAMLIMAVIGLLGAWAEIMGGDDRAMAALSTLSTVLGSVAGFVFQFFLWPWFYVVSDGKSGALGALRDGFGIAMHNKLTSFLLVLISTVLSIAGTLTCYVGQLVTFPLSMLMFAVAYLLITNQPVRDPKAPAPVPSAAGGPPGGVAGEVG